MSNLVPCPICGADQGYGLSEGSTYRWWIVMCKGCGAEVAECHSDRLTTLGTELPSAWPDADRAWNEAGKHAEDLRQQLRSADRNGLMQAASLVEGLVHDFDSPDARAALIDAAKMLRAEAKK